jgi:ketosteroid isomerase-like protein
MRDYLGTVPEEQQAEIRRLYGAFNRRDVDAVLEGLSEYVVWANGWEGGYVEGRPAVREYWARQFEAIQPRVEPEEITLTADGRVAVSVHQVVRSLAGEPIADQRVTHLFTFQAGKITRFDIGDTAAADSP